MKKKCLVMKEMWNKVHKHRYVTWDKLVELTHLMKWLMTGRVILKDQFFTVNDVPETKKVPALLSLIGGKTYKLLKNLVAPDAPNEKTYQELVDALKAHFSPKPLQIAERYRFHKRTQHEGESVQDFVAALKQLSIHCGYEGETLNENLRDRFIVGLSNNGIQKKLISKDELSFKRAVEIAISFEQASNETEKLNTSSHVHAMKSGYSSRKHHKKVSKKMKCMRCNGTNHDSSSCRYIETECDYCHKIGHIERTCMSKKQKQKNEKSENRTKFKSKKHRKLHQMDETSESDTSSDELNHFAEVNSMDNKGNDPMHVSPRVNGVSCRMQIDTGSARSIITLSEFKDKFPGQELKKDLCAV